MVTLTSGQRCSTNFTALRYSLLCVVFFLTHFPVNKLSTDQTPQLIDDIATSSLSTPVDQTIDHCGPVRHDGTKSTWGPQLCDAYQSQVQTICMVPA